MSVVSSGYLFHQFLKGCYQFVNGFIFTLTDISCHAVVNMVGEKFPVKGIDRSVDGGRLNEDIVAVGIVFQHSYDSPNLTFDTLQTVDEFLAFCFGAVGVFGTWCAATAGTGFLSSFFIFLHKDSFLCEMPGYGLLISYEKYPIGVSI